MYCNNFLTLFDELAKSQKIHLLSFSDESESGRGPFYLQQFSGLNVNKSSIAQI